MSAIIKIGSDKNYGAGWIPKTIVARGFLNNWSNFDVNTQQSIAFTAVGNTVFFGGRAKKTGSMISGTDFVCNIPTGFEANLTMGGAVGFIDSGANDLQLCNFGIYDNGANVGTLAIYKKTVGSIFVADFNGSYRSKSVCGGVFDLAIGSVDRAVILVPRDFSYSAQNKVCFYHHGSGDDSISFISGINSAAGTSNLMRSTVLALLADNWVVVSIDGGSANPENWGNPSSNLASNLAIETIAKSMNIAKIVCIGQSMGGLSSLRMLVNPLVSRWYGIYPVCSLQNAYDSPSFQNLVLTAFGGQPSFDASKISCDPISFPLSDFTGKKLRSSASSGDTVVPRSIHSDSLLAKLGGSLMIIDNHTGNHGDSSAFLPSTIIAHLNS